ncbi:MULTISPECIES: PIN domain protein [unclassified Imperialibacter]|uniref:PIN domain protein n=1 Tax=unclassified Imperialibacter TaxID=2629706 RepID=UPI0012536F66|nr:MULTISPECIES: PIN domain protein [unclassified Imperialibacter]CAD5278283.1 PIN domain protein [Imperialibacter sp. 75]CAD5296017.1 PIN domain protein [Imperialibacter sp. 89]VVT11567.1 PIN domain protein [Imperialibacter sp. EC-SDR9]
MKTIYIDTSVFGGKFDAEFELWTDLFFKKAIDSQIKLIYSDVAEDELSGAPENVRNFVKSLPEKSLLRVELSEEAILLAEKYLEKKVVGETSRADCYHIAIATVLKADILASWNFKHIVNIQRIHGYNAVNLLNDYQAIEIRNPREIFDYENDD